MQSATQRETSGEDRFLTLLVTQMRNQDPLNPLDNAQVTSQLAQINTVNGIERMNATLTGLGSGIESLQVLQAAGMVDRNVLVAGNAFALTSQGSVGAYELAGPADRVEVKVLDALGNTVYRSEASQLGAGLHEFKWNGQRQGGGQAPPGEYRLQVSATQAGTAVATQTLVGARVTALARSADGFALSLDNRTTVGLADVRRIY